MCSYRNQLTPQITATASLREEKKRKRELEERRLEEEDERRKEASTVSKKKKVEESVAAAKSKEQEDASAVAEMDASDAKDEVPAREVTLAPLAPDPDGQAF